MKSLLVLIVGGLLLVLFGGCKSTGISTLDDYDRPYITTQSPLTLLSSNDGEYNQLYQLTEDQTTDWELKTKDSFTVIHLGPDHPPVIKTVYDTVPATIHGTPTMAMSANGRYGIIANHSRRMEKLLKLKLPDGPRTNSDLTPKAISQPKMTAQHTDMLSLIDLGDENYPVVHRVLLDDFPTHVLAHPDGKRFIVGGLKHFYVFEIADGRLVKVSQSPQAHGFSCFWIHPRGDRLIATQLIPDGPLVPGKFTPLTKPSTVQWYAIEGNHIRIYGRTSNSRGLRDLLLCQMERAYCPVPNFFDDSIGALLTVHELETESISIGGVHVRTRQIHHGDTDTCLGYRIENDGGTLAYLPDIDYTATEHQDAALDLAEGADLLIHDAHHTADEDLSDGHSSDADAVRIGEMAGVGRVMLFHHHPDRSDDEIDAIVASYADRRVPVSAAAQGDEIRLSS